MYDRSSNTWLEPHRSGIAARGLYRRLKGAHFARAASHFNPLIPGRYVPLSWQVGLWVGKADQQLGRVRVDRRRLDLFVTDDQVEVAIAMRSKLLHIDVIHNGCVAEPREILPRRKYEHSVDR